jgi:hypothetical protein
MTHLTPPKSVRADKRSSLRLGGMSLGVAALLSVAVLPAQAQVTPGAPPVNAAVKAAGAANAGAPAARAALVQIADDRAHGAYQEGGLANCTFAGVCTVSYSPVPAGHRRLVEHMSCSVYVPSPGIVRYVALLANTFALPRDFFPMTRSPADPAQWFVNSPTLLSFAAGESPVAYAFADNGPIQELFCTISGRDIVLP